MLQRSQAELDRLAQRFGFALRGRVAVFLFAGHRDIAKVFGARYGGTALRLANAVVIAADDPQMQEALPHELAHLFAARWNVLAPPLLSEGLCTWLQKAEPHEEVDRAARVWLADPSLKLPRLLNPAFFHAGSQRRHACYLLAASFSGYLIRRFGWDGYRRLYRLCRGRNFATKFQKCFGMSLERAEWQWRKEVLVTAVLNRPPETPIALGDAAACAAPPPLRLLSMVLLLAVKDRATEVGFEPLVPGEVIDLQPAPWFREATREKWTVPRRQEWAGCRLRYGVDGARYDLVPAPFPASAIAVEVAALLGPDVGRRALLHFLCRLARGRRDRPGRLSGRFRVLIGDKTREVVATIQPAALAASQPGDMEVLLQLPEPGPGAEEAGAFLKQIASRVTDGTPA